MPNRFEVHGSLPGLTAPKAPRAATACPSAGWLGYRQHSQPITDGCVVNSQDRRCPSSLKSGVSASGEIL